MRNIISLWTFYESLRLFELTLFLATWNCIIASSQECGKQIHNSSHGTIKSPNYPETDPSSVYCLWEIQGNEGSLILVSFHDVDIAEDDRMVCSEAESEADHESCCVSNWLKIGVPQNEHPLVLCGRNKTPKPYHSTNPVVWIKYHITSSTSKTGRGFNLSYSIKQLNMPPSCLANETTCHPKSKECFPKCDHIMHCPNGADEMGCVKGCQGRVMCDSWNSCYTPDERCNGVAQCGDHSDERNCSQELCRSERGVFLCNNRQCIRESWQCDQSNDCGDNSDELNCLKNSVITAAIMGSLICGLLLVIAVGCTCKLYALRYGDSSGSSRSTLPLSPLEREILSREPPPPYSIAMAQSANYFQVASQAPHVLDPFYFNRLCRGQHHRRTRRIRRQRRQPPTPPSCLLVVPPDLGTAVVATDASIATPSEASQRPVPGRPIPDSLVYIPPGDISGGIHGCFDKILSQSVCQGIAQDSSVTVPNVESAVSSSHIQGSGRDLLPISIVNSNTAEDNFSPLLTNSNSLVDIEDDDDDRLLLLE